MNKLSLLRKPDVLRFLKTGIILFFLFWLQSCSFSEASSTKTVMTDSAILPSKDSLAATEKPLPVPLLDTVLYDSLQNHLVANQSINGWPVKADYPLPGAIFPFKRVIAYYGNFYSKGMGILGALPEDEMLEKLQGEVKKWKAADTVIPVQPAIHYIAVTAQHSPGKGNKYRIRMPFSQIDHALEVAKKIDALLFLDIQVGHSTLEQEIPQLEPYLKLPNVHLGIDPEFSMKGGQVPSSAIGTFDAADVNYASSFLDSMVKKYNLSPKVLVVHRFTKGMLTNYKNITLRNTVQVVVDMDGWGFPAKKKTSYRIAVSSEPVQFAGFKLFYKNDVTAKSEMLTPEEVLSLSPSPVYIQYQ